MGHGAGALENLVIDGSFWRGRRVLVTGHTGFMGGWLVLVLQRLGAEVHGYALDPPTRPCLFDAARIGDALKTDTRADICDLDRLCAVVRVIDPDTLFHLAAQPLVLESYRTPVATYATNVLGTAHVLEALRQAVGAAAIIITSDKCYRNDGGGRAFREDDPLGGADPYSSSKACAELVTEAYRASFFGPATANRSLVATARAGNVIGGGDWAANRLVPDCVRAAGAGKPVVLRHPDAVRPWQHVLDAVLGYIALVEAMRRPGGERHATAWNFGPDAAATMTVGAVAGEIMNALGGTVVIEERPDTPHEAAVLKLDNTRALEILAWNPRLPIRAALAETAAWYAAWAGGRDMAAFTRAQIERYVTP